VKWQKLLHLEDLSLQKHKSIWLRTKSKSKSIVKHWIKWMKLHLTKFSMNTNNSKKKDNTLFLRSKTGTMLLRSEIWESHFKMFPVVSLLLLLNKFKTPMDSSRSDNGIQRSCMCHCKKTMMQTSNRCACFVE
jgi:hypothetical protein